MSLMAQHVHLCKLPGALQLCKAKTRALFDTLVQQACEGKRDAAFGWLADMMQRVWVIEHSHQQFYTRVIQSYMTGEQACTPHHSIDNMRRGGLMLLISNSATRLAQGFFLLSYTEAIPFVLDALLEFRAHSLLDAPRAMVRAVFHPEEYPLCMRQFLMTHWLVEQSPDRMFWTDPERQSLLTEQRFLCFDDYILQQHASSFASNATITMKRQERAESISMSNKKQALDAPPSPPCIAGSDRDLPLDMDRLIATAHQYMAYQLATLPEADLQRLRQDRLVDRLFPLMLCLMRDSPLEPNHPTIQQLWIHHPLVLPLLARSAQHMAEFTSKVGQHPTLARIYLSTQNLAEFVSLYLDIRHDVAIAGKDKALGEQKLRNVSWLYVSTEQESFSEFLLQQDKFYHSHEQDTLHQWLQNVCLYQGVNMVAVQNASRIEYDAAGQEWTMHPAQTPEDAQWVLDRIKQWNEQLMVLRFTGTTVYLSELQLSLQYLIQREPELFHRYNPSKNQDGMLRSRVMFAGADHRGCYLVILRDYLQMLQEQMIRISMCSHRYHKNMPLFPVMLRLWMCTHQTASNRVERPEMFELPHSSSVPSWFMDDHSRDCVLQVLCHQLQLNQDNSSVSRKRRTKKPSDPAPSYVPRMGQPGFHQLVRLLHRFVHVLYLGSERPHEFPQMCDVNAVRQFLELGRERRVHRCAWMPEEADGRWHLERRGTSAEEDDWVTLSDITSIVSWYERLLDAHYSLETLRPKQLHQILCDGTEFVQVVGFRHLTALPVYYHVSEEPSRLNHNGMSQYLASFTKPYWGNENLSLAPQYHDATEPVSSMRKFLCYVEAQNSSDKREMILEAGQKFDVRSFFGGNASTRTTSAFGGMRAQLPVQAKPSRLTSHKGFVTSQSSNFVYMEESLAVLVVNAYEVAHMEQRAVTQSHTQLQSENLFLDLLLRFRTLVKLQDLTQLRMTSWHQFCAQMQAPLLAASKMKYFDTEEQLWLHLESFLPEQERKRTPAIQARKKAQEKVIRDLVPSLVMARASASDESLFY